MLGYSSPPEALQDVAFDIPDNQQNKAGSTYTNAIGATAATTTTNGDDGDDDDDDDTSMVISIGLSFVSAVRSAVAMTLLVV